MYGLRLYNKGNLRSITMMLINVRIEESLCWTQLSVDYNSRFWKMEEEMVVVQNVV